MLKVELEVFSLAKGALEANTSLSSSLFLCLAQAHQGYIHNHLISILMILHNPHFRFLNLLRQEVR